MFYFNLLFFRRTLLILVLFIFGNQYTILAQLEPFEPTPEVQFSNEALDQVNAIREMHGTTPLISENQFIGRAIDFAKDFQITAENIGLEKALILDYSIKDDDFIGFGLAVLEANELQKYKDKSLPNPDGGLAARFWYRTEYPLHNFDEKNSQYHWQTSHFSQMVWKDTKKFGAGKVETKDGDEVIVYIYEPYGNWDFPKPEKSHFLTQVPQQKNLNPKPPPGDYWDKWKDTILRYPFNKNKPYNDISQITDYW